MKKILVLFIFAISIAPNLCAQNMDSLSVLAIHYAAQNNIEELQKINTKYRSTMPHHFKLFCDAILARSEGNNEKVVSSIDSLYKWYPKYLKKRVRLSLAEVKAEALRESGKYQELYTHCNNEIKYFTRYGFQKSELKQLQRLKTKAEELSESNENALLLQKYDQQSIFKLDSLYRDYGPKADSLTQYRCEFLLSKAFHQPQRLLEVSQRLIQKYANFLEEEELTACITSHADELVAQGRWQDLASWVNIVDMISLPHAAPLDHYRLWAKSFLHYPETVFEMTSSTSTVPSSYEWPLLIKGSINGGKEINFCMGTEQPFVLIDESLATDGQIKTLDDTLFLTTNQGMLQVSPAILNQLRIGEASFTNVFVYVVRHSGGTTGVFHNVLGLNIWLKFDQVVFEPEQLVLRKLTKPTDTPQVNVKKQLFLSDHKGLNLKTNTAQGDHSLGVDCFYPNNILYEKGWKFDERKNGIAIQIGDSFYPIIEPQSVDYIDDQNDGILGIPFLRSYQSVCLDFSKMKMNVEGKRDYLPQRKRFGFSTDRNYLVRNYDALVAGEPADSEEVLFLQLLIAESKNRPEEVVDFSQQLSALKSDLYNWEVEAHALFQIGEYKRAAQLAQTAENSTSENQSEQETAKFTQLLYQYQCYANEKAPTIHGSTESVTFDLHEKTLPTVRIHKKKKVKAQFDIFSPVTEIAERNVKKFKVKRLGETAQFDYGIIPLVKMGHLSLMNIPCRILKDKQEIENRIPDEGKGIHLGWDAVRLFHQISFSNHELMLTTKGLEEMQQGFPLYYTGRWYIETESATGFQTQTLASHMEERNNNLPLQEEKSSLHSENHTYTSPTGNQKGEDTPFTPFKVPGKHITFDLQKMKLKSK